MNTFITVLLAINYLYYAYYIGYFTYYVIKNGRWPKFNLHDWIELTFWAGIIYTLYLAYNTWIPFIITMGLLVLYLCIRMQSLLVSMGFDDFNFSSLVPWWARKENTLTK